MPPETATTRAAACECVICPCDRPGPYEPIPGGAWALCETCRTFADCCDPSPSVPYTAEELASVAADALPE